MNDTIRTDRPDSSDSPDPKLNVATLGLPTWLARLVLAPGETVALVRGPTSNSPLEPYLTHPALFLVALLPAGITLAVGRAMSPSWKELHPLPGLLAVLILFGTVIFLAGMAGYFTRLIITDRRLLIVQGREVRSSRDVNSLPRALVRRGRDEFGRERAPTIDLNAVNKLVGGTGFVDAKTILTLSKKIDKLKESDDTQ